MADPTYDFVPTTDVGKVRLLVNDVASPWIFSDEEVQAFLDLEGGNVFRGAALAVDANATNEALASKVLRSQDVATDGAKVADAMRKQAAALRERADAIDENGADGAGYFDIVDTVGCEDLGFFGGRWGW